MVSRCIGSVAQNLQGENVHLWDTLQNHVMIQTLVKAFSIVYFTICVNLLLPHTKLIQICHKFGI